MKKMLTMLTLLIGFNSFALVCTSEENSAFKIKLTKVSGHLVSGESFIRTYEDIFTGTVKYDFLKGDTYTLFNQYGEKSVLTIKNELVLSHCRTRLCNSDIPDITPSIAKLSSENKEDEYFSCL
jgi:hypothetical protein